MNYSDRFIESYVHNGGIGVLVELGVSDSIVTRSDAFTRLAKDLAMHIAAMAPTTVEELLQQPSVKDPDVTVDQLVARIAGDLHEKVAVLRFIRWVTNPPEPLQPEPPRSPAVIYNLRNSR
jgi:elongation factor Ts